MWRRVDRDGDGGRLAHGEMSAILSSAPSDEPSVSGSLLASAWLARYCWSAVVYSAELPLSSWTPSNRHLCLQQCLCAERSLDTFYVWVEWWNLYFYESVCLWLCVRYLWLIRIRTSRTIVCESLTQIRTHCFKLQNISTCKRSWLRLPFTKLIACPNP